jgi:tRNA(Ile)-lysidine synthase
MYRGRVSIDHRGAPDTGSRALTWHGEPRIDVPEWRGALTFSPTAGPGVDASALRTGPLSVRARRGGERLRTRLEGPSRTLKNLYQEAGIAAWRRAWLPLVYLDDRLLMAAGLGCNAATITEAAAERVAVDWVEDR